MVRRSPLPPDFVRIRRKGVEAWLRPEARRWVEDALDRGETLHESAARRSGTEPGVQHLGRGPVHVLEPEPGAGPWIVRHAFRGGWAGPLLGDRHLRGPRLPRPFRELVAVEEAIRRGIPTPPVLAAAIYRSGPFYRGDVATRYLRGTRSLADVVFSDGADDAVVVLGILEESGRLVRAMASGGVLHVDLNLGNILVERGADGIRLYVLDLDRCRIADVSPSSAGDTMLARLRRSLAKWERRTGRAVPARGRAALERGFAEETDETSGARG